MDNCRYVKLPEGRWGISQNDDRPEVDGRCPTLRCYYHVITCLHTTHTVPNMRDWSYTSDSIVMARGYSITSFSEEEISYSTYFDILWSTFMGKVVERKDIRDIARVWRSRSWKICFSTNMEPSNAWKETCLPLVNYLYLYTYNIIT